MPDFLLMTQAALLAGLTAQAVYLILAAPRWSASSTRLSLGWTLGLGLGLFVGCRVLTIWPNWPPQTILDRWLAIVLPATVVVECIVLLLPGWMAWLLRVLLAGAVTPILLYGTTYLMDMDGAGTREWPVSTTVLIMAGLAAILVLVWALLEQLQARTSGSLVGAALFLSSSAAGVVVMLTGYNTGGQAGICLAGALAGGTLVSFLLAIPEFNLRLSGFGMVGLFSTLIVGRFFGTLATSSALCLLLAPLAAWIMEIPGLRNLDIRARSFLRLILVAIPLAIVVWLAFDAELLRNELESE